MALKKIPKNKKVSPQIAKRWIGHPVYVELNDGSYYVGMVTGIKKGELILSGTKGRRKMSSSIGSNGPIKVTGLTRSLFGGGGEFNPFSPNIGTRVNPFTAGPFGGVQSNPVQGGSGFFGTLRQLWPTFSLGFQMIRSIMPLLGGFQI